MRYLVKVNTMTNEQRKEVIDRLAYNVWFMRISNAGVPSYLRYSYDEWRQMILKGTKLRVEKYLKEFECLTDEQLTALILAGKDAE